jgi:hypothetical protein
VAGVVMIPSHFQQTGVAKCAIERTDKSPHDRTLLFDQRRQALHSIVSGLLRGSAKMVSSSAPNGFVDGGGRLR